MNGSAILGVEQRALKLYEDRATLLAGNIANSSTPNYKARDIDFRSALKAQLATSGQTLSTTNDQHLAINQATSGQKTAYRVPMQQSMDENTVDDEIERKNFIENSIRYQAGISFAQSKINGLIRAMRGE